MRSPPNRLQTGPLVIGMLWATTLGLTAGEIIDRVAVIVGDHAITQSEIIRELRTIAVLNDKPVDLSPAAKKETAERLVEQAFIRREMEVSKYVQPSAADTEKLLEQTKRERFGSEESYRAALLKYGIDDDELRQHLQWQLMTIRFIDFRFRPGVQVPLEDLREYYEKSFVPEWQKKNSAPVPSFEESRDQIEQILAEQRVDQALDRWINQQRTQTRIRFQEEAFR